MIRPSIPARQALAKLTLPVLIAAAFGLMLLGKADTLLADRAASRSATSLAPIYVVLAAPLAASAPQSAGSPSCGTCRPTTPGCARRTSGCGNGRRRRWRWMPRTGG